MRISPRPARIPSAISFALLSSWLSIVAVPIPAAELPLSDPQVLWQVGTRDGKPAEFALGAKDEYARFLECFPEDPRFEAGRDDWGMRFPYIHPGPLDAWAGEKAHVVAIDFTLAEEATGSYLLVLHFARAHYAYPPSLRVEIDGKAAGEVRPTRDGHAEEKTLRLPSALLRRGRNTLSISNEAGSWVQYDAISLERHAPGSPLVRVRGLALRDTPFFRETADGLRQVLRAQVEGFWEGEAEFVLRGAGAERRIDAAPARFRDGVYDLEIPPPTKPTAYSADLRIAGRTIPAREICIAVPHRKWTVHAALKTHYDLGYTHPVDEMLRSASGPMLKTILAHIEETKSFPEATRFRWVYPTWVLGKMLEMQSAADRPRLEEALRAGDVSWNAAPFTLHSYFCGLEDTIRAFYPSQALERTYGRTVRWAKQTDVPGHTRFLPQALARSGVRLLQIGCNFGVRGQRTPILFYWEAPDGSRVLTQLTDGYGWGFDEGRLLALESDPEYPFDSFLALHVTGDNVGPGDLVESVREMKEIAERYAWPRIRIGSLEEFADGIERDWKDRVPVVKTEIGDWWIHGVASMAQEVSLAREARERLTAAEKLWSIALRPPGEGASGPYPKAEFDEAFTQSLLFSEHTWGMAGFKPEPKPRAERDLDRNPSEGYAAMRRSWEVKGDEARAAWRIATTQVARGLQALAGRAGIPAGRIVVFNSLNWPRSDLVRIPRSELALAPGASIRDASNGASVPWQSDGDSVVFVARDLPPLGHASYEIVAAPGVGTPASPPPQASWAPQASPVADLEGSTIENERYRIAIDRPSGRVRSWVDLATKEELLDPEAPFALGEFVYEGMETLEGAGWHGSPWKGKGTGRLTQSVRSVRVEVGPVFARIVREGSLPIEGFPVEIGSVERVEETITLARGLDWVECEIRLVGKAPTALVEQGNASFPFAVKDGRFRLELLGSVVDPAQDIQDGGNHDAFAVQHWVDLSSARGGITWSPIDSTLVTLGDFRLFRWDPAYVPANGRVYANLFNNGWSTNFQEWQSGDFRFRFRMRSHPGDWLVGGAPRFGRETAEPPLAAVVEDGSPGGRAPEAKASHLAAESRGVELLVWKRAEDGDGQILRFWNPSREADTIRIRFPGESIRAVERVLANELPLAELKGALAAPPPREPALVAEKGGFELSVGPFAVETVRVRP